MALLSRDKCHKHNQTIAFDLGYNSPNPIVIMSKLDDLKIQHELNERYLRNQSGKLKDLGLKAKLIGVGVCSLTDSEMTIYKEDPSKFNILNHQYNKAYLYITITPKLRVNEPGSIKSLDVVVTSSEADDEALLYKLAQLGK